MNLYKFIFLSIFSANVLFCNPNLVSIDTSLSEYPACSDNFLVDDKCEYTLPDLHGNALKLLNALITTGFIAMPKNNYKKFADCYFEKLVNINQQNLSDLRNVIASITVTKKMGKVRFIGDELGDRGSNDYYTLLIIEKLANLGIKCEFIISNHGFEFIQGYETGIYTHAPAGLEQIKNLSIKFGVEYKDDTIHDLSHTIDKINDVFQKKYVATNLVHTIQEYFSDLIWNRDYKKLDRPENHNGYKINFVHGHDSGEESSRNIYNLDFDNKLGKSHHEISGKHQIFICKQ